MPFFLWTMKLTFCPYINNHRQQRPAIPGTVKLWESPQQSWGVIDDYYIGCFGRFQLPSLCKKAVMVIRKINLSLTPLVTYCSL